MLIEQGQQASQAGNHTLALQRAEQAMAIQVTPSLRLFYARELVHASRPADAFAQAEVVPAVVVNASGRATTTIPFAAAMMNKVAFVRARVICADTTRGLNPTPTRLFRIGTRGMSARWTQRGRVERLAAHQRRRRRSAQLHGRRGRALSAHIVAVIVKGPHNDALFD
jgi:hypothetical protein